MALTFSKRFYLLVNKNSKSNVHLSLGIKIQHLAPVVHYCNSTNVSDSKMNKVMSSYLKKVKEHNEFIRQQIQEFELGKKFLARMMGRNSKEMTQEDIDEAIDYLFPSGLFVPKARPMMKPPHEIFGKERVSRFDSTGRPYHYLYYTLKPNLSECLHNAATTLERLNGLLYKNKTVPSPLSMTTGKWLSQEELSKRFMEKVFDIEYNKFLEVFNKLAEHPFASEAEEFINSYRKPVEVREGVKLSPTVVTKNNITVSTIKGSRRKTSTASVSVSNPGSGQIRINNTGLDYFITITPREQVSVNFRPGIETRLLEPHSQIETIIAKSQKTSKLIK